MFLGNARNGNPIILGPAALNLTTVRPLVFEILCCEQKLYVLKKYCVLKRTNIVEERSWLDEEYQGYAAPGKITVID